MLTIWKYKLRFVAPAFLGDSDRNVVAWRTPPFKAQLRQWWRVAYAAQHRHEVDIDQMRAAEAALFGAAADGQAGSTKSKLRLRLDRWDAGRLSKAQWKSLEKVRHDEVNRDVAADLYLGYGPVTLENRSVKVNAAIDAGEEACLSIALTDAVEAQDRQLLQLAVLMMHRYGAVGGRSRNAWGSYVLEPIGDTPALLPLPTTLMRPWREALQLDWPHALGQDERGPLVWGTQEHRDWRSVMVELAKLKIGLRLSFKFNSDKDGPERRHWLAYPVTNHSVKGWGGRRLPNSLRMKLRLSGQGQVQGVLFHMPVLPVPAFQPDRYRNDIVGVWREVHGYLDRSQGLRRMPE